MPLLLSELKSYWHYFLNTGGRKHKENNKALTFTHSEGEKKQENISKQEKIVKRVKCSPSFYILFLPDSQISRLF